METVITRFIVQKLKNETHVQFHKSIDSVIVNTIREDWQGK
jgi:hypothetical protein